MKSPPKGWPRISSSVFYDDAAAAIDWLVRVFGFAEAHCERAREAGAIIRVEPTTEDYGEEYWADRTYEAEDLEGHHWFFMQRLRG